MVGRSIFLVLLATRVFADAPVARIADVRHAAPGGETIIVRGTVTMVPGTMPTEPDSFYIQDASGAISVHAPSHLKLSPTQEVEVEGTIHAIQENEPEVQATRVTVLRRVPRILPRSASGRTGIVSRLRGAVATDPRHGGQGGDWRRAGRYLRTGGVPDCLRCYLRHNPLRPSILITQAPVGAEVEVTGLALPSPGEGHALRMRDSVDLALIRRPYMLTTGMLVGLGVAGVIALLVVAWNLTLRRSIRSQTREIRALLTKAEEASQLKSEFLANLSHEIRTPIHAVQGMHALLAESNLSPDQQEELAIAQESTRHLLALLDDVIDLARIESGRMVLESLPIDPAALLHRILRSFEPSAQRKGLTVECRMGDLPAGLTGDPTRSPASAVQSSEQRHQVHRQGPDHGRSLGGGVPQTRKCGSASVSGTPGSALPRTSRRSSSSRSGRWTAPFRGVTGAAAWVSPSPGGWCARWGATLRSKASKARVRRLSSASSLGGQTSFRPAPLSPNRSGSPPARIRYTSWWPRTTK